ncbi:MAG TPA: 2-C-methyl-D-erythritol 2,4-cyclodiphosphate synthase [Planctomycetota bacterium]|nr:2-C-methyl-D-erythritol 2,4-cyclodiphosphate synthase [Planctomycetota bacterium]
MFRIGLGFDNHRLARGRPLVLGGISIPSDVGEEAHSDGDVLLHALCDALYGAAGQGDIGEHFPDSDPRWKGQSSDHFLREACAAVSGAGFRLVNVDATVFLEHVKLSPHKKAIAESIRRLARPFWELEEDSVNIKAKTCERCDAVGRGEAVGAQVAVLLERRENGGRGESP